MNEVNDLPLAYHVENPRWRSRDGLTESRGPEDRKTDRRLIPEAHAGWEIDQYQIELSMGNTHKQTIWNRPSYLFIDNIIWLDNIIIDNDNNKNINNIKMSTIWHNNH